MERDYPKDDSPAPWELVDVQRPTPQRSETLPPDGTSAPHGVEAGLIREAVVLDHTLKDQGPPTTVAQVFQ